MGKATLADWALAGRVGRQVAALSAVKATGEDVARIRASVDRSVRLADEPSRAATGLGDGLGAATARVVSRGQWIDANLSSMQYLTDPHAERLLRRSSFPAGLSRRAVAVQVGSVFGYLSTRVLGQYEVFLPGGETPGRLTLVGPNLLQVERDLAGESDIDADELILGIVLHELGHRLQFEAVPWLRPHLRGIMDEYLSGTQIDPERVRAGLASIVSRATSGDLGLRDVMEAFLTPEQADKLEDAQAVMSLLEGHGNVVMDWGAEIMGPKGVDPARVRTALNRRRAATGGAGKLVGKALGMGLKAAQYSMGETFIAEVAERHGREAFNRVWESPDHIPTLEELADPDGWAERIAPAA
ncbi:zinc-dependent metalloprotease [Euzebya tangerina]|uniref:zinc-dependent metalloprotease n=1 Tax=Euzebya tangerina TaxID=591198 RepID=UPI0013C2D69B|nr:zinc-dependent metalloprotease [Euzebya tangerina]